MPSRRSHRVNKWMTISPARIVLVVFLIQLVALLYYLVIPTQPRVVPALPHHHGAQDPKDYTSTHSFIIVGILSDRTSEARRDAVRETWLRLYRTGYSGYRITHKFVIGQPYCKVQNFECDKQTLQQESAIADEAEAYGDILRVNVLESYNTLSEKLCALVEWAGQQSFDYFLKTDHDIFIRLDTIVSELSQLGVKDNYWRGFGWHDVPPIADSTDKNREVVYDLGKFPPYTAGALHILSSNLVRSLSSELPRRYYQNEDQTLGIWLLPFNATPIHDKRIQQWDVCDSTLIAKHPLSPEKMKLMYDNVVNGKDLCSGFDTNRCPLCYDCRPDQHHWLNSGLTCDDRGASVGPMMLAERNKERRIDEVTAGVLGYLPFITCKPIHLKSIKDKENYVRNGGLDKDTLQEEWTMQGRMSIVEKGMVDYAKDPFSSCIELTAPSQSQLSYISQMVELNQVVPEPIVISGWSKAEGVDETNIPEDYSLFANIKFSDGTDFQAFVVHFDAGTHDWQHNLRVFNPENPISKVELFCVFRFHQGTVWFDNISLTKLTDSLCAIKSKAQYFRGFMPANLNQIALPKKATKDIIKFILIWTTPETTFLLRHHRVIESIFFHHPDAHVKMFTNTLPLYTFHKFNAAGYNIEVVRYDINALAAGLPGQSWVGRLSEWEKGESFYAHLADFLRFTILFREGGVYSDMDSILLRPIDEKNVIGVEHCDQETLDYCIHLSQFSKTQRYYLPIGFLVLAPEHPLIFNALSYFDSRYDPDLWPCGTIYLTLAYSRLVLAPQDGADHTNIVRILPREAFYPIPWQKVKQYFKEDDGTLLKQINSESYAFHLWGGMTVSIQPEKESLVWRILNQYSIMDRETAQGPF